MTWHFDCLRTGPAHGTVKRKLRPLQFLYLTARVIVNTHCMIYRGKWGQLTWNSQQQISQRNVANIVEQVVHCRTKYMHRCGTKFARRDCNAGGGSWNISQWCTAEFQDSFNQFGAPADTQVTGWQVRLLKNRNKTASLVFGHSPLCCCQHSVELYRMVNCNQMPNFIGVLKLIYYWHCIFYDL